MENGGLLPASNFMAIKINVFQIQKLDRKGGMNFSWIGRGDLKLWKMRICNLKLKSEIFTLECQNLWWKYYKIVVDLLLHFRWVF